MLLLVSHGANVFNLCPFPDSPALYIKFIPTAVWPHFPGFWIVDPLKPPKCRRGVSWGELFLPMSIPRWIHRRVPNVVPIGRSVWQLSETSICDPLKPPQTAAVGYRGANCFYPVSISRWIHRRVPNLVPIGPSVWQLSQTYICDPVNPPKWPPL